MARLDWEQDPEFQRVYAEMYPFEREALFITRVRAQVMGMTQEQFAAEMGVTVATIRRYESGKVRPSRRFLS